MAIFRVSVDGQPVTLPMDRYKAEQFLYDQGLDLPNAEYGMDLDDNSDFLLVLDSNFREFNRLARQIDQMGDYDREKLTAWCDAQDMQETSRPG